MKFVVIGYIGQKTVYINMSKEEAMQRYNKENLEYTIKENNLIVTEMEVEDCFNVYDIWSEDI